MTVRDAVVVGGGVIGCAIARDLARAGYAVTLLERGKIGAEASAAAAGTLGVQSETENELMLQMAGASRRLFPTVIEALANETGSAVEFCRDGTLYLCFTAEDEETLETRRRWQQELGFSSERLTRSRVLAIEPHIARRVRSAVLFPDDGRVDGAALTLAYARAARRAGCDGQEGVEVRRIAVESGRVSGVETTSGRLACDLVINAAGAWAGALVAGTALPIEPVRGQIVVLQAEKPLLRHAVYSPRGYAVGRRNGRILLGTTREQVGFEKRVTASGALGILAAAFELSSALRQLSVCEAWAGLRPAAPDRLPIIGRDPAVTGYYVATGHYRNGILLAPLTAALVLGLLRGEVHPWLEALRPERFAHAS